MITHIARQGKVIGKFSPDDLLKALQNGTIKPTDHWWRVGMKDWIMVSSQSPLVPDQKPVRASFPEAGRKILIQSSKHDSAGLVLSPCCTPSGKYRREIFHSLKLIESFKAGLNGGVDAGPGEREIAVKHLRDEIESAQFDIESLYETRAEYWIGLMDVSKKHDKETLMSMHIMYQDLLPAIHHGLIRPEQVMEPVNCSVPVELNDRLYRLANRLPKIPSQERVLNILKQLDEKSRTWDDDQPDLLLLEFLKMPG
jgi:hypothetical protein